MRNATLSRFLTAAGLATLLVVLPFLHRTVAASSASQAPAQAADGNITTTLADQTDLALTVYNSNLSLVRDVRQLTLPAGESLLRFMDIAASINPATVHFRSLTEPAKLNVLEQNYEYDLLDPNKLLQKYVGREVTMIRGDQEVKSHPAFRQWRTGLEDRQRHRHEHRIQQPAFPRSAGQSIRPAHAVVDAPEFGREASSRGSVVPDGESFLERGLCAERGEG